MLFVIVLVDVNPLQTNTSLLRVRLYYTILHYTKLYYTIPYYTIL